MGVFTKFKDLMGFEEYEEDDEIEEADDYKQPSYYDRKPVESRSSTIASSKFESSNVVPMQNRTVKGNNKCI